MELESRVRVSHSLPHFPSSAAVVTYTEPLAVTVSNETLQPL
jgi:hypothetical protein